MQRELTIAAPFHGTAAAIGLVPDPVFSAQMVGPGLALVPHVSGGNHTVCAPVTGVIGALFPHAFAIETDQGVGVLVHLGIDTVALNGQGFELLVSSGQFVTEGQPLIIWNPEYVGAQGKSVICPIVLVQQDAASLEMRVVPGQEVTQGQALMTWRE